MTVEPLRVGDRVFIDLYNQIVSGYLSERQAEIYLQWHGATGIIYDIGWNGFVSLHMDNPVGCNADGCFYIKRLVKICKRK